MYRGRSPFRLARLNHLGVQHCLQSLPLLLIKPQWSPPHWFPQWHRLPSPDPMCKNSESTNVQIMNCKCIRKLYQLLPHKFGLFRCQSLLTLLIETAHMLWQLLLLFLPLGLTLRLLPLFLNYNWVPSSLDGPELTTANVLLSSLFHVLCVHQGIYLHCSCQVLLPLQQNQLFSQVDQTDFQWSISFHHHWHSKQLPPLPPLM